MKRLIVLLLSIVSCGALEIQVKVPSAHNTKQAALEEAEKQAHNLGLSGDLKMEIISEEEVQNEYIATVKIHSSIEQKLIDVHCEYNNFDDFVTFLKQRKIMPYEVSLKKAIIKVPQIIVAEAKLIDGRYVITL